MFGIGVPVDRMVVWGGLWVFWGDLGVQNQGGGMALKEHTKHVTVRELTFPNMYRFGPELNQCGPRDMLRLCGTKNGV